MEILLHASAKKKTKRLKVFNFALLWVVLKWLHGSQGDKDGDGRRVGVGGLTMLVSVMGKT